MKIKLGTAALALIFFLSGCSSSLNEDSSGSFNNSCQAADEEDLKLATQVMIDSGYRIESGFTAMFPPRKDGPVYIVAPPYDYVLAATIRGSQGDSVVGLWGIWRQRYGDRAAIFALNKETQKYSIDLAYWDDIGRGEEFTASAEDKVRFLQRSVDTNLISCFQN
jgi:hypothetical protein